MEGIENILPRVLRRMGATKQVRQAVVEEAFGSACGAYLRPYVRVASVEGSTMVLACAHPAIAHQLQMEVPQLLAAVNAAGAGKPIARIRFVAESGGPTKLSQ